MSETPDVVYGRLLEAAHISGYSFERVCDELDWLLDADRWRAVAPGYDDINGFLDTVDLSPFKLDSEQRKPLVVKLHQLQAKNTRSARALGVDEKTIRNDLRDDSDNSEEQSTGMPPEQGRSSDASDSSELPVGQEETTDGGDDGPDESETQPSNKLRTQANDGDEWYTPRWLFDALGIKFSIDVCAPLDLTHTSVPAERHLTIDDDGLAQPWHGTVWCNPPYSKPEPWARRLIHHRDGLLLTHMPMNAGWCVDTWEACDAIRLFQAMEFVRPDGSTQRPGYWLQLAAFGSVATEALARLQPLGDAAANKRRIASPMWRRAA